MTNRQIPHGYIFLNGAVKIEPHEQKTVIAIFDSYRSGHTMRQIVKTLTAKGIAFSADNPSWNVPKVMRVLKDNRYLGTEKYPSIITDEVFNEVQEIIKRNSCVADIDWSFCLYRMQVPVICPVCGNRMYRRQDPRRKSVQRWRCKDTHCSGLIMLPDKSLLNQLQFLINQLVSNHILINIPDDTTSGANTECIRLRNEIESAMLTSDYDEHSLIDRMRQAVSVGYDSIDDAPALSRMIRAEYEKAVPGENLQYELLNRTVKSILLKENGTVTIELMNGQIIAKEETENAAACCSTAEREKGYGHTGKG